MADTSKNTKTPKKKNSKRKPSVRRFQVDAALASDLDAARDIARIMARRFKNSAAVVRMATELAKIDAPRTAVAFAKSHLEETAKADPAAPVAYSMVQALTKAVSEDENLSMSHIRKLFNDTFDAYENVKTVTLEPARHATLFKADSPQPSEDEIVLEKIRRLKEIIKKHVSDEAAETEAEAETETEAEITEPLLDTILQSMAAALADIDRIESEINALVEAFPEASEPEDDPILRAAVSKKMKLHKASDDDAEERIAYGIVLEPETVDKQKHVYSAEEIRKTAYRYMENFQKHKIQHKEDTDGVKIVESFIAPTDFEVSDQEVKKGTWVMAVRVTDDNLWESVKNGDYTGFSIGGDAIETPETT